LIYSRIARATAIPDYIAEDCQRSCFIAAQTSPRKVLSRGRLGSVGEVAMRLHRLGQMVEPRINFRPCRSGFASIAATPRRFQFFESPFKRHALHEVAVSPVHLTPILGLCRSPARRVRCREGKPQWICQPMREL
jgi:hypothetical protein